MRLPALLITLLPGLVAAQASSRAETLLARYEVQAGGFTVLRLEAAFDLDGPGYRVRTRSRPAGLAGLVSGNDQSGLAEGLWRGADPLPDRYRATGGGRGDRRQVSIDYPRGAAATGAARGLPLLRALEPPNEDDREAVPEALTRDTVDALSALAKLLRTVAATGRCEATAAVYDGRRRVDYTARTEGLQRLPQDGGFGGEALRCAVESRLVAGRRARQDPAEAWQPEPTVAWLATVAPARRPLPVRIEVPTRWFGTLRVVLQGVVAGAAAAAFEAAAQPAAPGQGTPGQGAPGQGAPGPAASGQDAAQQRR